MRYTPAQIKEALEITEETLRHWRKILSPLQNKRGHSPCFSPGDLLALQVIARFHALGVNVSQLKPHAEKLFQACSQVAWFGLEDKVVVYDGQYLEMVVADAEGHWSQEVRIAAPLGPLIQQLRRRLSEESTHPTQAEIAFPPMGIAQGSLS